MSLGVRVIKDAGGQGHVKVRWLGVSVGHPVGCWLDRQELGWPGWGKVGGHQHVGDCEAPLGAGGETGG